MNRAKAQAHLDRVAGGLPIQHPFQAHHPARSYQWNDGPDLLSVTSGLSRPYRVTSSFSVKNNNKWLYQSITRDIALGKALLNAANNHPLRMERG